MHLNLNWALSAFRVLHLTSRCHAQGVGLCHGIAGTGYALLSLYRLTRNETHLCRAQHFGAFAAEHWRQLYNVPDAPASLYLVRARIAVLEHDNAVGSLETALSSGPRAHSPSGAAQGLAGAVTFWADLQDPDNARLPGYEL